MKYGRPDLLLLQSPPAIPTFFACQLIRLVLRVPVLVDFHNLAYTLMRTAIREKDKCFVREDPLPVLCQQETILLSFASLTVV
jgi:hypothetical protein